MNYLRQDSMSVNASRIAALNAGGFYLPAIAMGYLYTLIPNQYYLYLAAGSLVGGVWIHTLMMAASGHGGWWENPAWRGEKYQRIQAALWSHGSADDYPESIVEGVFDTENHHLSRYPILFFGFVFTPVWMLVYAVSIFELWTNLPRLDFIGLFLLFALIVWELQRVIGSFFPAVFLKEQELTERPNSDPHIQDAVKGFGYFFGDDEDIEINHLQLDIPSGGVLELKYTADRPMEDGIVGELHALAYGYAAFVKRINYPSEKLEVVSKRDGGTKAQFEVKADWVQQLNKSELLKKTLLKNVAETADIEGGSIKAAVDNEI